MFVTTKDDYQNKNVFIQFQIHLAKKDRKKSMFFQLSLFSLPRKHGIERRILFGGDLLCRIGLRTFCEDNKRPHGAPQTVTES